MAPTFGRLRNVIAHRLTRPNVGAAEPCEANTLRLWRLRRTDNRPSRVDDSRGPQSAESRCYPTLERLKAKRKQLTFAMASWLFVSCPMALVADDAQPVAAPAAQAAMAATQPSAIVRAMRNDAALADVCFSNASLGWAVGDRGVIWHTADGGSTWHPQQSNTVCNLRSVFFIDAHRGWAVGGECRPLQAASHGIVLRTDDGGNTWTELPRLVLPRLTGVKFFDRDRGVVFGEGASLYPAGVFATRDGGNTWQPLAADAAGDWLAGDFLDSNLGAVAGPAGQLATLTRQKVVHSPLAAASLRAFRAMRLVAPTGGWAVGDGGLLMTTHDAGRSWQTPPADLPEAAADHFDFHAVAVQSPHVWVAGAPGTRIFHSPDNGQTWQSIATGQSAPLRALTFVDAEHGWAAGDLGNILATHDGGHTWQVQRSGGGRAALLALFAQPTNVPLELLADSGAADGYIAAVNILCTPASDASASGPHATPQRQRDAMLLSGAASADATWRFPLPPADLALAPADLLQALNRENDGRAMQQLESHLVRELRMWRPEVVVTHHGTTSSTDPMAALTERLVMHAIEAAADPTQHPELANDAGLAAWPVKKVYGVLPPGERGDELLAAGRFSPWLGAALGDFVAPARSLLFAAHTSPPDTYELKLLLNTVPSSGNTRGIFGGIALAPGSDARRPQADLPTQDLEALRRLATRRRHLQELMDRSEGNAAWAGQVSKMIDGLSPEDGGQLLVQLAEGYRKTGRLDLAADTYFLLARRFPDHPLVDSALHWLVQFYASSEMAHHIRTTQGEPASAGGLKRQPSNNDNNNENTVRQANAIAPIAPGAPPAAGLTRDDRLRRATQLADYLQTARPALYAEPSVRFAETTAQRELGFANPAQRFFLSLRQLPDSDPWRQCAATEEWLAQPADLPPAKKLASCRPADHPPNLDGKPNEPFWTKPSRLRLSDSAEAQLAYDSQFLYIAIRCQNAAHVDYTTDNTPRPHDADLTQHDRVTLRIDIDRDYATAFELTVDNRGWTHDACWGDVTWNPAWYVAAASDDTSWTVEAAVPLSELVEKPPAPRHVWAVSAQRIIPRVGYQSWAGPPASKNSPAQFGLLIFE